MLNLENFKAMFECAAAEISAAEAELCALDSVCGDGDHGVAMKGAINAANAAFQNSSSLKSAFFDAGFAAMSHSNGSTSTLFGALLMGISEGIEDDANSLDAPAIEAAFKSGLSSVRDNTKADVGDKTLMDALIPAVKAMSNQSDEKSLFNAAAQAAKEGAESTKSLKAKFGRAKNLGEKSIGSIDAGAMSDAMLFAAFAKSI